MDRAEIAKKIIKWRKGEDRHIIGTKKLNEWEHKNMNSTPMLIVFKCKLLLIQIQAAMYNLPFFTKYLFIYFLFMYLIIYLLFIYLFIDLFISFFLSFFVCFFLSLCIYLLIIYLLIDWWIGTWVDRWKNGWIVIITEKVRTKPKTHLAPQQFPPTSQALLLSEIDAGNHHFLLLWKLGSRWKNKIEVGIQRSSGRCLKSQFSLASKNWVKVKKLSWFLAWQFGQARCLSVSAGPIFDHFRQASRRHTHTPHTHDPAALQTH